MMVIDPLANDRAVSTQVATNLSPTNPYGTIIPLIVVFIITLIKQGIEDFKRHQADYAMNNRMASVSGLPIPGSAHWLLVCVGPGRRGVRQCPSLCPAASPALARSFAVVAWSRCRGKRC